MTNCSLCVKSMFFVCRPETHTQYMKVGTYNKGEMQIFTLHKLKNNFLKITVSVYGVHRYAIEQVDHWHSTQLWVLLRATSLPHPLDRFYALLLLLFSGQLWFRSKIIGIEPSGTRHRGTFVVYPAQLHPDQCHWWGFSSLCFRYQTP